MQIRLESDAMSERLSIRSYGFAPDTHAHSLHQVVVPLRGRMEVETSDFAGVVTVGQCVIIPVGLDHTFQASTRARFLVADLRSLPDNALALSSPFASVSRPFRAFCQFAELQLSSVTGDLLNASLVDIFAQLLARQEFLPEVDRRIARALDHIDRHLDESLSLQSLSALSNISISQFKLLFRRHTGMNLGDYLKVQRMETAKALLINTDTPIARIAEQTGFSNASAFTRRFRDYHGTPPRLLRQR